MVLSGGGIKSSRLPDIAFVPMQKGVIESKHFEKQRMN